ncbi:MAG: gliding motility-associated C-terminal domain-containing protein, partial [Flavobacteriales bacterium]
TATATLNTPIACNGGTAVVNVTASGGTAPLSGIGSFTVSAGNQSFTVTDANGCSVVATLTVTEPTALSASVVSSGPILCNGGVTDVTVSGTGGTPSYAGIGLVSNLTAGNYSYTITDANGCSANTSVSITEPDAITLAAIPTNVTCNAGTDGAVDLTVTGGTPGFTFTWSDGSSNEDLTNVVAGNYSVIVSDANGCSNNTNVTINEPSAISATTSSTPASCNPDGTASVTVSGGVPGYTYLWSNGATTNSITGVAAGNYTVNITDANNCTVSASATIAQTSGLTASATLNTPIACNGGTAIVDVTASGGTAPLGGVGSYTVAAGNQSFTVTDANGCSVVATLTVTEPTTLSASVGTSNVTCNGANDGILSANVTGGTPNYSYSWSNGQSTNTITNLGPGSINLTVTDGNGCVATGTGTIVEPTALGATNTAINISCNGAQDGSIDLTVSGGTPGYTYLWNDPNNTSSEDLSNASAGTYTVLITDNNNCVLSYNVSLTQPNALLANSNVTTPIVVNGGTGVITVGANGGTPSYTGTGTYTVTSGTYTYTVTDANGCSSSTTITITEPNALQATATITSNILCNGGTGIIDINGVGGVAPYTGIGPNVVVAGTYTYTITDAGNATASITITITEPSLLTATISSSNITCYGANNGTAAVTASGGTAPYTYLWINGPTSANVSNLAPGTYSVVVTDANGCTASANVTITEPTPLAGNITSTDVTCNGLNNGTASVTASGGSAPYTYLWNNNATSTTVSNLSPGNYTVTVTDANGCTASANVNITEPTILGASSTSTDVTCNGLNNGTASVTASGGTAPYTYLWSNGPTSANVSNLAPGTYSVVVTDANGCTVSANVNIIEPAILGASTTSTNISCNGLNNGTANVTASGGTAPYTYLWNNNSTFATVANLAPGNYSVTVTDANGCTVSANVNITEPAILGANTASTDVTCNGLNNGTASVTASGGTAPYTYLWNNNATSATVSNLAPGNYTVTVTDANGCTASANVNITEPTILGASTTSTDVTCNGLNNGTANVTASGGTAPYTYLWNNNATSATVSNLAPGNYTVTVTDANGCTTSANATISQPSLLTATTTSTNVTCNGQNNGTATGIPAGGISPYTFLWSNNQTTTSITNLNPGNYSVTITDANNCTTNASVTITQPAILTANSAVNTPILCNGGTATITVTAIGGTSPYTNTGNYTVNAGTYTYTVNDVNGCIAQTTLIVNQPNALTANSTVTQAIACFGGTGQISITASGGTSPYNGTGIQTVLTGTYSYTVTDLNGCSATTTIAITEPPALSVVVNGTNPLCNGTGNGSAIANPSGGTAPYTYAWSDGQTTVQATNLASGTYTVTVTDANGCIATGSVTLSQPANLTASSSVTSPILCFGGIGVVTVTANGGTSPYTGTGAFNAVAGLSTYTVTDANGCSATTSLTVNQPTALVASSAVASSIPCFGGTGNIIVTATGGTPNYTGTGTFAANAGPHTYTVTDANGCSTTTTLTISQPSALNPIASITNPIACNGGFATINVSANGGTPAYSGVGNFAALAGVQNYTVIDANGCSASVSINVTQPTVLTSSITSQNVTCNGLNNGSATATGQGGTSNYTYLWSNGATTATVTNLSPGAYSVTVTDANGCQSISNVVITQPTTLSSSVVQTAIVPCFGSTGTVFVSATGGSAPYVGTGNFSVVAGNQSFTVTDVNGCTSVSSLLITQPTQLVATASQTTPILCFGGQASVAVTGTGGTGSYTGTGSFNVNAGNNTFTIQDANGCSAFTTISIAQPTAVIASFNNTSVSCFGFSNGASTATVSGGTPGYSYLWSTGSVTNTINNQFAGNYGLQVTDANGCIFNFTTSINQPAQMVATANIILPIACFGGQAIVLVNGAGGTPGYSGNGTFFEFAGTYTYTLVDQNGCIDSTTITVTQPPAFTAVATITSPIACNGGQATVVVSANGGTAPYTGTGTFTVSAGNYTYTIIDANGCTATTTITVSQPAVLTATATIINPILCNGGQATVQVSANGGTTPYAGTGIFNVVSGNYNYIVSDVNGCNTNVSINVPQPTLLQSSVSQNNVTCNGANDGSAIVFFNGGTPQINVLWSTGATTNSISNLAPGNYSVTVTDANGCTNINALTITQPNTLVATATEIVPIQCFNGNATVVVAATGGTSPFSGVGTFFPTAGNYIYPVTDANGCSDTALITINQPTQLTAVATIISPVACFGGLATVNITAAGGIAPYQGTGTIQVSAGNQSFTVTDANGCALTITLFIAQPPILNTQVSVQNVSCFNAGNGSATVVTSGGTPGYQYLWSNGDTTAITNNLIPGVYTITVTDTNGCQTTNQATITQPTLLTLSASITTPVFCFGGNATVSVSATGGTAPYTGTGNFNQTAGTTTYYVTDANGCLDSIIVTVTQPNPLIASVVQTSPVACNGGTASVTVSAIGGTPAYVGTGPFVVIAGWQNFTVTDNYGCTDTTSIFITQPPLLVASATLISPILCNGGTAVVDITAAGGTPSYSGLGSFTVVAGTYTYTVSDANGCTANVTITVTQPNPLQAVATISSPIICNGGTGVITVTGTGGTAPYVGTGSFTVAAGTYTYTITDANNCSSTVTIVINQPPVLSLSLTPININCNGFATGSITANPAGGQGPYTYVWSNGQTSQSITNLLAGLYTVTVTDNLGCTVSGNTTLTQPANPLALQESHVNILCFGNNTGSIDLSVTGGTSPYSYAWSNGSSNQDIQGLIAGSYNVTVTDANGCIAVLSVNVTQPAAPLSVSYVVSNVSCFGLSDGAIDVTPVGGTGPFTFFWTSGQSSEDLNNIPQGIYIVAITDANNCVSSAQISVTQPTAPLTANISQNPISCYGYNDGQLTANAQGGTLPYSYLWTPGGQTGSIVSSLGAGNYSVTITDANGCSTSANDVLNSPPPLIASFTASDNVVCLPSNVTFTNASIGTFTNTTWNLSNGTSFNGNQFTTAFNTLGCFDVTLLITDANGCTADTTLTNAVCVVPGPSAAFVTGTPEIDFVTGEMEFINNSQNYTGSFWTFGDGGNSTLDNPIHFYPSSTIDAYNVMLVVYDANGCSDTAIAVVESSDVIRLTVPNAFTPNGDGLNDLFIPVISNPEQAKYYQFDVFNRWGQIVFSSNKPGEGWDGKYKGKLCPFGTYNWKVSFDVTGQESTNANGHVTMVK